MLTQDQLQAIKAPFPPEALSADTSRGFELISTKAAYVIERLNPDLAIVDRETWKAVRAQRERNKALAKRNRKYDYLLSCRIKCTCGRSMFGSTLLDKGGKRIYRCHGRVTGRKHLCKCKEPRIDGTEADALVWGYIEQLLDNSDLLLSELDEMECQRQAELEPWARRLATIREAVNKTDRKLKRLARAFAEADDETSAEVLNAELKRAASEKEALLTEQNIVQGELEQGAITPEVKAAILDKVEKMRRRVKDTTFGPKRELLDTLDA